MAELSERQCFKRYEQVRSSGKYNMATEAVDAMKEAGLTQNQYFTVLFNYTELKDKYGTIDELGKGDK